MNTEDSQSEDAAVETPTPGEAATAVGDAAEDVKRADFSELGAEPDGIQPSSLKRFYDVQVTVTAELGRVTMPMRDLVALGEGSVVELDRTVSGPVELTAQGVRIATGEVVVVDECFAVRIKSIESSEHA